MPGIRGKRVCCGHVGALFVLRECQQFEGAKELQSLPWRPLALRGPGREFAAGQGGHASTTDGHVTVPPTIIECADDQEATGMPSGWMLRLQRSGCACRYRPASSRQTLSRLISVSPWCMVTFFQSAIAASSFARHSLCHLSRRVSLGHR
jgi:hypothetical protein